MQSSDIRQKFLKFFQERGHAVIPSASLIPENDPSVLFTTAGMHPLVPYLKGGKHPLGNRLADVQKCIRTGDIDEVGDPAHLTFFEMLGYWSLGDYFKKESIRYTFDFYTEVLGFDKDKISVTVFEGDDVAPFDEESYGTWKDEIGIPVERIYKYGKKENWWGLASGVGPCGPDTEMFIDTGKESCGKDCGPACDCGRFIEIGNNVFVEFLGKEDGSIEKLAQRNVDVGLGLERLTMFAQGRSNVYETDLFAPVIDKIEELGTEKYNSVGEPPCGLPESGGHMGPPLRGDKIQKAFRIIADHLRAATFIIGDENGVTPSNNLQGYVLRRLIRRAVRYGKELGLIEAFTSRIAEVVIEKYKDFYPELGQNRERILSELNKEEMKFEKSLERGLKEFEKIAECLGGVGAGPCARPDEGAHADSGGHMGPPLRGTDAFLLFQSYGFPFEMTKELADERGIKVDEKGFWEEFEKHQKLSQTASAGMFKGGLADSSEETVRLHTAAHLLLASLRRVLGDEYGEVNQKGSNITTERLRFDFNYPQKLTAEQIQKVEDMVNDVIERGVKVEVMEMSPDDARNIGASGVFDAKYGDKVKVYKIGDVSMEICGGPHVSNTKELGHFRITKEESSSSGIRRIKAVVE